MKNILIENRRARFDYQILENYEGGIMLTGKEVKSLKNKRGKLEGAYGFISNNEAYLVNMYISPYQPQNLMGETKPDRTRKLLLKRKEINYLIGKLNEKKLSLVPLRAYLKNNRIKIELGLARGKSKRDKRESIKKRETERETRREVLGDKW